MNPNRKAWNERHQLLLSSIENGDYAAEREIFVLHHAQVHSARLGGPQTWSFEDEVLAGLDETMIRRILPGGEHSIAWNLWHIARIEDVTMNLLVAGQDQRYFAEGWFERMQIPFRHCGNAMDIAEIESLSAEIDLGMLREYRVAVGRRTREIVSGLTETEFKRRVDASRLERVMAEGAVQESAREIVEYWRKKTVSGLLLMPATRHNFLHLNECLRLRH